MHEFIEVKVKELSKLESKFYQLEKQNNELKKKKTKLTNKNSQIMQNLKEKVEVIH
jgi:predicted transcriptional regulator